MSRIETRLAPSLSLSRPLEATVAEVSRGARRLARPRVLRLGIALTDAAAIGMASAVAAVLAGIDAAAITLGAAVFIAWCAVLATVRGSVTGRARPRELRRVVSRSLGVFGAFGIAGVVLDLRLEPTLFTVAMPIGLALLVAARGIWRTALRSLSAETWCRRAALVVGEQGSHSALADVLAARTDSDLVVAETVTTVDDAVEAVLAGRADTVVMSHADPDPECVRRLAWELEGTGASVVLAAPVPGVDDHRLSVDVADGLALVTVSPARFEGLAHAAKRSVDLVFSLCALIVLAPMMACIALAIRVDSAGAAIYRQTRIGRDGRQFTMLKFRSMSQGADDDLDGLLELDEGAGVLFKIRDDPRVTRVGAFIRRYSLDELPQLVNILRGDMSLVGPRPPLPREVAAYDGDVTRRLLIRPGLTGLWQVSGRSDLSWEESVRLDLSYVENWSFLGDMRVIAKTVGVVLRPVGAY